MLMQGMHSDETAPGRSCFYTKPAALERTPATAAHRSPS